MSGYDLLVRASRAVVGGVERSCALAVRDGRIVALLERDAMAEAAQW
jgi:hypothetical protein